MGVSHTLFRRFSWSENILWKEDIRNRRVTVVLSGKDLIVDTKAVRAYLTEGGVAGREHEDWKEGACKESEPHVLWFPELDHGQVFDKKSTRAQLVDMTRSYCDRDQATVFGPTVAHQ
jgi:hypothetical protein